MLIEVSQDEFYVWCPVVNSGSYSYESKINVSEKEAEWLDETFKELHRASEFIRKKVLEDDAAGMAGD